MYSPKRNTLTHEDLQKIAAEYGLKVQYRKYRMWHSVPFIGNTAMVVDEIERRGGYAIITDPSRFPSVIDCDYIRDAIDHDAVSLGKNAVRNYRYEFTPWHLLIGKYPAGYFTHKVGEAYINI